MPSKNIEGKGENAGHQRVFLLFPQCSLPFERQTEYFEYTICRLQMLSILTMAKILSSNKGLRFSCISFYIFATSHKATITERDHIPHQPIVIEQVLVTE